MARYWLNAISDTVDDEGQRECARGDRCLAGTSARLPDGTRGVQGAFGYQAFCRIDRSLLIQCLEQFPGYWRNLRAILGEHSGSGGEKVSGSRTASLPLNLAVDTLMEELVHVVASWAGRVAFVADLHAVNTDRPLHAYVEEPFQDMCVMLSRNVDAFIGLGEEAMTRFMPNPEADLLPADVLVHRNYETGVATAWPNLTGAAGGLEVIGLNNHCRSMLGLTGKDEPLPVPCWNPDCQQRGTVVRPDGTAGLADYARCRACGEPYDADRYILLMKQVWEWEAARRKTKKTA